jgi:hypothetical protein
LLERRAALAGAASVLLASPCAFIYDWPLFLRLALVRGSL